MSRQEEWSDAIGLRRAAVSLVLRGLCALPLWAGAIWAMDRLMNALAVRAWLLLLAGVICGGVIGLIMSKKLAEQAGMVSVLVSLLAAAATGLVLFGGWAVMSQAGVAWSGTALFYFIGATAAMSLALIVRYTALDE